MGPTKRLFPAVFLLPLLFSLGHGSPDLGFDITIDYVTSNSPNILSAANDVNGVNGDLQGSVGGFVIPKYQGMTNLTFSGAALVSLVGNITGPVNNVLRNISTIASNRLTAPSCMFASLNGTLDKAYSFIDQANSTLVQTIITSTSSTTANSLMTFVNLVQTSLQTVNDQLDALYIGVQALLASGSTTKYAVDTTLSLGVRIQLAGAISILTTAERNLNTVIRTIRTNFDQANNILNSYTTDLLNAQISVNNTQRDYYNQVTSRITSYQNKVTSDTNSATTDVNNLIPNLNTYAQSTETDMRTAARGLQLSMTTYSSALAGLASAYKNAISTQMTQIFTGAESFVQTNVQALIAVFDSSSFKLAATMSNGGPYASNCNGRYGGNILNLDNNMRDQLNRCFNDYANTGYTDSFISEYNNVIREQTRFVITRINFCFGLGSVNSDAIRRAGIAKCFTQTVQLLSTIIQDIEVATALVVASINLESLAMVQRVESCGAIMNHGLVAAATSLDELLASCQTTNQ
ncbi:uncharacterized protein LOC126569654 [Anopheles aquasalis]|uniref:uncharacterized protein LOC126569654 n=1 Tax=Anopheles aquasalis TaxID=42839 RepID=UPI00215A14B8|nr:uncharacterized protein LOC126569654 [Anopheles aquasalis]